MMRSDEDYPLGHALEFLRRLWRLNHALESLSNRMDRRIGVTAQQRLAVRCVGKYPGVTAGQLAALLHVDPGTASVMLKRLEEKGVIERRYDPRDKRRVALGLTAKGRQIDRPMEGTVEEAAERLINEISPADVARVAAMLERLTSLLETSDAREPPHKSRASRRS
jgi:DNA-binding MarR family transcriptional regulator